MPRECYECGKVGRLRLDYPDLPRNKNKYRDTGGHAGSAVAFVASLVDDNEAIVLVHYSDLTPVRWVVDSGASMHCSVVSNNFTDPKLSELGSVDGINCQVEGVGNVIVEFSNR